MLWGYFKKLVIADRLAMLVTPVFGNYTAYHGMALLLAAVAGAFQLYCDFSGCMDMVLGISEALGITVEENFSRPFFSKTAAEFWRRWHITLGTWFKDYIYMPLVISPRLLKISGNIRKKFGKRTAKNFMSIIPLAAVWLLTGIWHGTGYNYIAWGIYWGALIILSTVLEPEIRKLSAFLRIDTKSRGWQTFCRLRTFFLFVVSRIITIPGSLRASAGIFKSIFTDFAPWQMFDGSLYTLGLDRPNFTLAVLSLILLGIISKKQEEGVKIREAIAGRAVFIRWAIYLTGIFAVLIFGIYGAGYDASSFVYMNY